MNQIVFYSWQSDLPNRTNRGFIQEALEKAAHEIRSDDAVAIEPVVDRDTQGVPGAPDIASTIFSKITASDVFVADVSIIERDAKRATPNPNVLIELGYALKALGPERIILVFNRAFGRIEQLPFDLKMRRVVAYDLPEAESKADAKKVLEQQLEQAIRSALERHHKPDVSLSIPAVSAIENQAANRVLTLRRNLTDILKTLDGLQPKRHSEGGTVDDLIQAIQLTQEPVAEFSKIVEVIAAMGDDKMALEVYHWFGQVFERYDLPKNFSGISNSADQDFFKFLGHELFVTLVAFLLREQQWLILRTMLWTPIPVKYLRSKNGPANVYWNGLSAHIALLLAEGRTRQRISLHADILNERHTTGGLAAILPMSDFVEGDFLLLPLSLRVPDEGVGWVVEWRPWSTLYLEGTPLFLRNAEQRTNAEQIQHLFHEVNRDKLVQLFNESASHLNSLFSGGVWRPPIRNEELIRFGTR